ncbi:LbetaH domain-containing protein [Halorhabdus amylolytica]|uniref:acetyltransferase n=1 Tax=Halorhabdus amylolytica TaxID=2559573 RepID=UPI0010AA957F|nr:acetyltransferase [Halorhabdus amylolytica]
MRDVEAYGPKRSGTLRPEPTVHDPVRMTDSELGDWTEIHEGSRLHASSINDYTYLMERVQLDYAHLGKYVSVATASRIGPPNHPIDRPTAHHFTYRPEQYELGEDDESIFEWRADQAVEIGHDVWIGHGAIVLPDVTIGNGAVVGAGSVVTDDVEPYMIVAGSPAKPIRRRFPPEIAARIEATEWWHWDHETVAERLTDFRDLDRFLSNHAPEDIPTANSD